jgi:hypothetical protein
MRNLQIAGSTADRVHAGTGQLKGCEDLGAIEYRYSQIVDALEDVIRRASMVRWRGGSIAGLDTAAHWLDQVVRSHWALDSHEGETLRAELRAWVARIRERAQTV